MALARGTPLRPPTVMQGSSMYLAAPDFTKLLFLDACRKGVPGLYGSVGYVCDLAHSRFLAYWPPYLAGDGITLPRRFKYSDNRVWHENSAPGQPRHFRVLKHKRRDVPSITPIPQFRFEGYTLTKGQAWHAALDRASVRPNQRRALAEVFAAENGSTEFTTNEVAGVTRDRLAAIGPSVGISADTPLGDLSLDHLVVLYVGFIDDALVAVGARPH